MVTLGRWFFTLAACICCATAFSSAQAYFDKADLMIALLDSDHRLIPGAHVIIVKNGTSESIVGDPASEGYRFQAVPTGVYRVEAEAAGFTRKVVKDVHLEVGQLVHCDIELEVGNVSTTIEVEADLSPLRPDQAQQADIINEVQVENFPNTSRNFVGSIYTLPGVANSYAPTLQTPGIGTAYLSSGFSVGASNGRSNLVTIDGGEDDYGSGTMRDMHVPIDSIKEFQVNRSSFEAEFGFTSGTAINMVTKSGTNQFHGTAAGYFHDRTTDAGDYFDKLAAPGVKPFEQSVILSATLGGPIRKDHLFFFTAPEYQRLDEATVQNIAGQQQFQGISSQANGYNGKSCPGQDTAEHQVTQLCYLTQLADSGGPLAGFGAALLASPVFANPLDDPILNALVTAQDGVFDGIPASPVGSGVRGLPGFSTPRGRYFNWVTHLDYSHAKDNFALRFALMRESDSVAPRPPYSGNEFQTDYTLTASWTRVAGKLVNEARAQAVPSNTASVEAPSPNGSEIDLGNQVQLGTPFSYPYYAHFRRFQLDDSLSWTAGTHTLKMGGSWRPDYYSVEQELWFRGNWQFLDGVVSIYNLAPDEAKPQLTAYNVSQGYPGNGPASTNLTSVQEFLAGLPTVLLQADPESNSRWSGWTHLLGLYAQDTWRARPALTLDYGVRVDFDEEPSPVPGSIRVSPRAGLAWSPGKDPKTVVRAGGGVFVAPHIFMIPFYVNILGVSGKYVNQNALEAGLPSPPFPSIFAAWNLQQSLATKAFPNPPLNNSQLASLGIRIVPPGPAAFGNFIYTMSHGFEPAYTIQASLSIARQITRNLSLEAGYLMYHSEHVEQVLETNFVQDTSKPIDPFIGPFYMTRPGFTVGEPNAHIFQNDTFSSVGSGTYHGGTISLNQRFSHGWQYQANYTFSRSIDNTSDFSSLSTPFRPDQLNRDFAQSDFNITHSFVANAVYTTPINFRSGTFAERMLADLTVSPILSARSGVPFTLLVPGLFNYTIGHNATARPWQEGRNDGIGAHFVGWDLRVSKILIRAQEQRYLEVIAQAQNVLNHTNFAAVNNNFPANPNYPLPPGGTLEKGPYNVRGLAPTSVSQLSTPLVFTAAYPARQISLALRLTF
jgi:hypothetical protein